MSKLYLIRHARPDIPLGKRLCIGTTDIPLGTLGKLQGVILEEYMKLKPTAAVYCSNLSRAVETAQALTDAPILRADLHEMYAGQWDGLDFDTIRERWPTVYALRGTEPSTPIPDAEPTETYQKRFYRAVTEIMESTTGDIAIMAHASVIQGFLCLVLGKSIYDTPQLKPDYIGISTLEYTDYGFSVIQVNEIPKPPITDSLCERLLIAAQAPVAHCRSVAEAADRISQALLSAGVPLNPALIHFGALLHDLARAEPNHSVLGAQWLEALGYEEIAEIVRYHHDAQSEEINEQTIVYLADKLPVEQRFAQSKLKCTTAEALAAHTRRYKHALALKHTINRLCGKEIVP